MEIGAERGGREAGIGKGSCQICGGVKAKTGYRDEKWENEKRGWNRGRKCEK